jgi:hypothetical protein
LLALLDGLRDALFDGLGLADRERLRLADGDID